MLMRSKNRAKAKSMAFDLTEEDFPTLPLFCPVLGIPLTYGAEGKTVDGSPSFERIDNSKGYIKGNVIIVSWRANNIKSNATLAELQAIVKFYEGL